MRRSHLIGWIVAGLVAAWLLAALFPRAEPLFPSDWTVSRAEAEAIAIERIADIGPLPEEPYIILGGGADELVLYRMEELVGGGASPEAMLATNLFQRHGRRWTVTVYNRTMRSSDWIYRARVNPSGEVVELQEHVPENEGSGTYDVGRGLDEADAFLESQGMDLSQFEAPTVRSRDLDSRTDTTYRYQDRERALGSGISYGVEVRFAGDRLVGFTTFFDDEEEEEVAARFQSLGLIQQAWIFLPVALVLFVAIPFVRRYHAGEIGVSRGLHMGATVMAGGILLLVFCSRAIGHGLSMGILTRPQVTWVMTFNFLVLFFSPMALMVFLSYSVGESLCREHWGHKLAGLDAFFRGEWNNSTFARASLRGVVCGLAVVVVQWAAVILLRSIGAVPFGLVSGGPGWSSAQWFGIPVFGFALAYALYTSIFGQLMLVPYLGRFFGRWLGPVAAAAIAALLFFPSIVVAPAYWTLALSFVGFGAMVLIFLKYGIFTALLAQLTVNVLPVALPMLQVDDSTVQLQASLLLVATAVPLIVSARHLTSDREFVYRYEDVPPHVRRIAERERQKVELETARRIQSSILPQLPPELNGVRMVHTYLPATEVGGDFYDVLALEDGRLAVAVGDVAGHGVSSGLVMSMAKSALAVQVSFNPEVEAVFGTLNRMVYQSARKRLLTTLCYALIDPARREMFYASAGHLFPYRITRDGKVEALESVSYPLGVRDEIDVRVRATNLAPGDLLFMFSDGVVEARPEGSEEMFGFERLEDSLKRHSQKGVAGLKDGVLADLDAFVGGVPLEDDLTVLALELPAA